MIKAYFKYWKKAGDFKDYSSRSDYWWVFLANFIIFTILSIIHFFTMIPQVAKILDEGNNLSQTQLMQKILDLSTNPTGSTFVLILLTFLAGLIILVPNMSLTARRLRDAGFPWWLTFLFGLVALQELSSILWNTNSLARLGFIANVINLIIYILCLFPTKYGEDEADDSRQYR